MSTAPAAPSLIVVFLDQKSNTFKVATDQTLKLQSVKDTPGITQLGVIEVRPKPKQEGLVGQPDEMETIFIPLINYAVDIVAAKKVELATEVPPALKKTSRVNKKK
jgi:hypothetical protein